MIQLASRLPSIGMLPLAIALALDIYVVCLAALGDARVGAIAGTIALWVFAAAWFAFPLFQRERVAQAKTAARRGGPSAA